MALIDGSMLPVASTMNRMSTGLRTWPTVTTLLTVADVPIGIVAEKVGGAMESCAKAGIAKVARTVSPNVQMKRVIFTPLMVLISTVRCDRMVYTDNCCPVYFKDKRQLVILPVLPSLIELGQIWTAVSVESRLGAVRSPLRGWT